MPSSSGIGPVLRGVVANAICSCCDPAVIGLDCTISSNLISRSGVVGKSVDEVSASATASKPGSSGTISSAPKVPCGVVVASSSVANVEREISEKRRACRRTGLMIKSDTSDAMLLSVRFDIGDVCVAQSNAAVATNTSS